MRKGKAKNIWIYVIIFGLVFAMAWFYSSDAPEEQKEIKTSTMVKHLKQDEVEEINVTETKLTAELSSGETVYAYVNSVVDMTYIYDAYIMPKVDEGKLKLFISKEKRRFHTRQNVWRTSISLSFHDHSCASVVMK